MPVAVAQRISSTRSREKRSARQSSKQKHYGIEVVKGLVWREWEPGGEYTKHVVLKNVNVKTQKFKYSSPSSRFFSTLYPEPITLSAGTSYKLPVTFRPLEKNVYEDSIEFHTKDGSFKIPIIAVLPKYELMIPEHLNFGFCATQDQIAMSFELQNVSELKTDFRWSVGLPFTMDPSSGSLEPKSKCTIVATFKPTASLVYETVAECLFGDDDKLACKRTLKLEGIGKYSHLLVSPDGRVPNASHSPGLESLVSFGEVSIGQTAQRCVQLHNLSPVNAPYTIKHPTAESRMDTVFHCPQNQGTVPAHGTCKIPVMFTPCTVSEESIDYIEVHAVGEVSKTNVKLVGKCKGPRVHLGEPVLDFGRIQSGSSSTCSLKLINDSSVAAVFQFMIDGTESVFRFSNSCDTIEPNSNLTTIVRFKPVQPINYFRRVACLVQNQEPLFVDLIGTCHTELAKPAVLQPKHLTNYRIHEVRGFSIFPPEQLNEMLEEGKLERDEQGALLHSQAESIEDFLEPRTAEMSPMDEFFSCPHSKSTDLPLHISMDIQEVDFGRCQNLQHVEQRTVNVTNHTKGKITVVWMGDSDHVFSISPTTSDIPPLKMTSFRVSFKPDATNQFYGSEFEGYAFYKSMRDYRLVQDETFAPPWCLTLSAVGSTFQPGHQTFLPRCTTDQDRLVFPAVDVGDSVYKTILLTNTGDTPIHYRIPVDLDGIFKIKPRLGLTDQKHQLFALRMSPEENASRLEHTFRWTLNESEKHSLDIAVRGSSEQPAVLLDTEGVLCFKPTCLGTTSSRTYQVRNISRVPMQFTWILAHTDQTYLKVEPTTGTILPNESQTHVWSFTPKEERKYISKPYMQIEDVKHIGDEQRQTRVSLRVIGEGSQGDITTEEPVVDLSHIVVGTAVSKELVLYNNSRCTLHYRLAVDQRLEGSQAEEVPENEPIALELDSAEGVIPARSRSLVRATVRPRHRLSHRFNISYELCMPELDQSDPTLIRGSKQPLCELRGEGVYPTLHVTDARCYGSASGISKSRLWKLFSLDILNMELNSDPLPEELNYVTPTRHSTTRKVEAKTRAVMDFNFSAAPAGSEPCTVHFMLENKGAVTTDWAFLFPSDMHLELEYWAETGEFDVEELHEMRVMDNNLFNIEPSRGQLAPGQEQSISFSYRHEFPGTDRLPVMLKVSRGREILLNFTGVTVDREAKYVHFASNKHMFEPVAIGNANSAHQVYEMYNGGAVPVEYHLDLTVLEILQQENFDQRIFECLNPSGEIGPGKTAYIDWVFSPFEANTYSVSIPIHIIGGDTALITFSGIGYDSRILGDVVPTTDHMEALVPVTQKVSIPGQLVYLSQERISFGNMPVFSKSRQVVYVKNNSPNHAVSFEWFVNSEEDGRIIDIQPATGSLEPGEVSMCKICFTAVGQPAFHDLDIVCEVTDEQVMAEYQRELEDWEEEREKQKYEFTITDPKHPASHERLCRTMKSSEGGMRSSPDEFKKYNTLPPIKNIPSDKDLEAKQRQDQETEMGTPLWEKPTPPEPFVLHLGVTGRTLDISEFHSNFPSQVGHFYIDRSMGDRLGATSRMDQREEQEAVEVSECSEAERDVIEDTLATIIRALLDDHKFHDALGEISKEPIPYFTQFEDPSRSRPESQETQSCLTTELQIHPALELAQPTPPTSGQSTVMAESTVTPVPSGDTSIEHRQTMVEERQRYEEQALKRCPEFGLLLESVLENTIFNVISEARRREVNLTARPRLIALPPSQKPQTPPRGKVSRSGSESSLRSGASNKTNVNSNNIGSGIAVYCSDMEYTNYESADMEMSAV